MRTCAYCYLVLGARLKDSFLLQMMVSQGSWGPNVVGRKRIPQDKAYLCIYTSCLQQAQPDSSTEVMLLLSSQELTS